ncbi:MAG TPA: type IV toxin-antitoxin system AbiEi family antitoxin domain-containing protein [Acidimicrobiia bacterium]
MDADAAAAALAARQHNLVTRWQAHGAGFSDDMIRRRVRTGRWRRTRRGVYAVGGAPPTFEQAVMGAVLAAGGSAAASHATAAVLWGLPVEAPGHIEITTVIEQQVRLEGVVAHRTGVIDESDRRILRRIPVASVARTVVDLSMRLDAPGLARLFDEGLRRGLVSHAGLHRCVERLGLAPGRSPDRVHALLAKRIRGYDAGDSALETDAFDTLIAAGVPAPARRHPVSINGHRYRIDLAYARERIAIELDGYDFHRTRSDFDADRARGNELVLAGWTLLRFTSNTDPADLVAAVSRALGVCA